MRAWLWLLTGAWVGLGCEAERLSAPEEAAVENDGGEKALPMDASQIEDGGLSTDGSVILVDAGESPFDGGMTPTDAGLSGPQSVVRFIAMGDTGEGNQAQYEVSSAVETVCMVQGCDFVMLLGDNFYDQGVSSSMDEQFDTKFESPYANIQLPFFVTLGNHDFGLLPVLFWKTDYQIEYTTHSSKWNMPDHFYSFVQEHVTFISLDTNMIMLGLAWVRDQRNWFQEQIQQANTPWVVAYGHHPYRSNGAHGNAGNYEGAGRLDITGEVSGRRVESFFEDELCGNVDVYLAGHDHNRQWLEPQCGVELIVSGAGAKLTPFEHRDNNPVKYEDDTVEGFFWIEIADNKMTIEAWNRNGGLDYQNTVVR